MPPHASPRERPRRALPLRPRPERRLPVLAFMTAVLAALVATCYLGGLAVEPRLAEPDSFPALPEAEPPAYREDGPQLLVCTDDAEDFTERNEGVKYIDRIENERRYADCLADGFRDLASAVAAAEPGTNIQILPGHYAVDETTVVETDDLQIEGLGDTPDDVQISAHFSADTVLNAYGANGLYITGIAFGQARSAALRLVGVRSVALDAVSAFQSGGAGILVEDSVGVALTDCRAEAADTAGILIAYAQADVTGCESTANAAGIELRGDNVNATAAGNRLHGNATGLVVADTGPHADVTADANLVYDNNHPYADPGACADDPAERDWSGGVRCPDLTYPVGVGLLLADADGVRATDNRIWNQQAAAIAAWGAPGPDGSGNRNTVAGNEFGIREDGQRQRNRLDIWWDGTGVDNCFDEPDAYRTAPAVLPACDAAATRVLGDPLRTLKAQYCGIGDAAAAPDGCDWFGARFTERLEFRVAVAFAAALLFLSGLGWFGAARSPEPPRPGQMTFSAIATGGGALLLVLAVWSSRADYEALAIGLWGFGWILAGRSWRRCGLRALGALTALIGALAVLDAIDRGVRTIPLTPIAPAWLWLALLPLWILLAIGAAFGPRRREPEPVPIERTPVTAPSHNRFDW